MNALEAVWRPDAPYNQLPPLPPLQEVETKAAREGGGPLSDQAQVYDHLYRFFSRYYDKGDFMSKRYFVAENDQRAAPYAVPYDGREVMLHWANKDQYYIKSSEHLSNYSFDLTEALRMEAQRQGKGQELDFGGDAGMGPMKVHFRLAAATEGEHNNVKESQDRFFVIHADEPIKFEAGSQGHVELVVQFEYRPDPDKTGQANTWQQQKLAEAAQTVLQALQTAAPNEAKAQAYARGLASLSPTEKRPDRTVLAKYMAQFADRNTMDYFIHKDLGGFRMVEGHVFTAPGDELSRERVLVIWRKLTGDPGRDQAALEAWLSKMKINPRDTDFAAIYVNGSHALNTDGSAGTRVCMIEETFAQRMWEDC